MKTYLCQICEKDELKPIEEFSRLPRITSDCRPFFSGGMLTVCMFCGGVQKITDNQWLKEIEQIYADYNAYRITNGEEQFVVDPVSGKPQKRSYVFLKQLQNNFQFAQETKVLDFGCGDGVTLKAISDLFATWKLYGYELDEKKIKQLMLIPQFKKLLTGSLKKIEERFDLVTMIHSLEHCVNPLLTLQQLHQKITLNGSLFVQICNIDENPFDVLIADHLMHFSPVSLKNLVERCGFQCESIQTMWIKKEISLLAKVGTQSVNFKNADPIRIYAKIKSYVTWLNQLREHSQIIADRANSFGIFGTSIASTWLANELSHKVRFFVDEDPNRIGQNYMNKPIVSPRDVPRDSTVYLALAPSLATSISERLQSTNWNFKKAPELRI